MFQEQFPEFNSYGWGVSVKAERWNGRHAMFGWAFIIATGYCKAHGLIPDPEKMLDFKSWGTLAIISGGKGGGITITNGRASSWPTSTFWWCRSARRSARCPSRTLYYWSRGSPTRSPPAWCRRLTLD